MVRTPLLPPTVLLLLTLLPAGCSRSSSGGGSRTFAVTSTNVGGADLAPINGEVRIVFSDAIAPSPVPALFIFESESNGTRHALGELRIQGRVATFVPQLPILPDLSDAGLKPDTHYTICVPRAGEACAPQLPAPAQTLRSRSGKPLARSFMTTFRTLGGALPFRDPLAGPPMVTSTDPAPGATEVPVGTPQQPTLVTVSWNEPLLPASVTTATVGIHRLPQGFPITLAGVTLAQTAAAGARLTLTPRTALTCDASYEIRWSSAVTDLAGNPAAVPSMFPSFRTTTNCPPVLGIVETFETADFRDPAPAFPNPTDRQVAEWFISNRTVLRAGLGFGGSGVDGELNVPAGAPFDLATVNPGGTYQFTTLTVPPTAVLTYTGANPLRILCTGPAHVQGTIDLQGGAGSSGPANNTSQPVPGGAGRAGGGSGGTANLSPGSLSIPINGRGEGPQNNLGAGFGGHDSHITTPNPVPVRPGCGGGGGSHGGLGINGDTSCANASMMGSLRGNFYGNPAMTLLLGGSGGGAGGNGAPSATPPVPFPNLVSHAGGGGGAGGGALGFECAEIFTLGPAGRILMNGGNAGPGGGPAGPNGGSGGGGSGGGFKLQALTAALDQTALIRALGGLGGPVGGTGGFGRVRLEDQDSAMNTSISNPTPSVALLTVAQPGRTVGQSRFYDTGRADPTFIFDGSDPGTGRAIGNTSDLEFAELPVPGQTVTITFQGAPPDPGNPGQPDPDPGHWFPPQAMPGTGVPFATDIGTLSGRGLRFIRFRIEFDIGAPVPVIPSRPSIDTLRIRTQ